MGDEFSHVEKDYGLLTASLTAGMAPGVKVPLRSIVEWLDPKTRDTSVIQAVIDEKEEQDATLCVVYDERQLLKLEEWAKLDQE